MLPFFLLAAAQPLPSTITTDALATLLPTHPILIDVLPAPQPPPDPRPGLPRLQLPHQDIPGSHWLPDTGRPEIPPARQAWMLARLAALTGGDHTKPIVVYCMAHCQMSWNAAKRIAAAGYSAVIWYPDGANGWAASGRRLAAVQPDR